jgi:hypothetical protein
VAGPIKDILTAADSTIRACDTVFATCEQQKAVLRSQIANMDSLLGLERKRGTDWKTKLGYLLVGAAVGTLVK